MLKTSYLTLTLASGLVLFFSLTRVSTRSHWHFSKPGGEKCNFIFHAHKKNCSAACCSAWGVVHMLHMTHTTELILSFQELLVQSSRAGWPGEVNYRNESSAALALVPWHLLYFSSSDFSGPFMISFDQPYISGPKDY